MAKKKRAEAGPEAAEESTKSEATVSKADAVRAALKEGLETPEDGVKFIKEKFGIDIPNQMFSSYKSLEKKKAGNEGAHGKAKPRTPSGNGHSNPAELARQVKALVEQFGAEAVRDMTDVFSE